MKLLDWFLMGFFAGLGWLTVQLAWRLALRAIFLRNETPAT